MTKTELIKKMAEDCGLTLKDAETVINTFISCIIQALASGDKVELRGLGSFRTKTREPRRGRNPKTGAQVDVLGKMVPFFKAGKELRALIDVQPEPVLIGRATRAKVRKG